MLVGVSVCESVVCRLWTSLRCRCCHSRVHIVWMVVLHMCPIGSDYADVKHIAKKKKSKKRTVCSIVILVYPGYRDGFEHELWTVTVIEDCMLLRCRWHSKCKTQNIYYSLSLFLFLCVCVCTRVYVCMWFRAPIIKFCLSFTLFFFVSHPCAPFPFSLDIFLQSKLVGILVFSLKQMFFCLRWLLMQFQMTCKMQKGMNFHFVSIFMLYSRVGPTEKVFMFWTEKKVCGCHPKHSYAKPFNGS